MIWSEAHGWQRRIPETPVAAQLVLVFGSTALVRNEKLIREIQAAHPNAFLMGCSTAGEICGTSVTDDSLVATAIEFAHTRIEKAGMTIGQGEDIRHAGRSLAGLLPQENLKHVFVLSEGLHVNGSELVKGLTEALPEGVGVTGGLSGDGARFQETVVLWEGRAARDTVVAVGFYGGRLKVGCGSLGGWDPFGPERIVTRSAANKLYELDGKSVLELYKMYLGEHAAGLPASGLLFPLSIRCHADDLPLVRTILAVNEEEQSMTFAGDVPEGASARLMKANFDRLVDGAEGAASTSCGALGTIAPELAILISCVGRKMVLQQRIEEELEGVRAVTGESTILTGFYSYGELSPFTPSAKCELHNQTMTVTTFAET